MALLLVLGLIAIRLPYLLHPYTVNDEAGYGVVGMEWLQGGRMYLDALERRPPGMFLAYAARCSAGGGAYYVLALHVVADALDPGDHVGTVRGGAPRSSTPAPGCAAGLYGRYAGWGDFDHARVERRGPVEPAAGLGNRLALARPLAASPRAAAGGRPGRLRVPVQAARRGGGRRAGRLSAAARVPAPARPFARRRRAAGRDFSLGFAAVIGATAACLQARGSLHEAIYWVFRHHDMPHPPSHVIFWERLAVGGAWFGVCCFPLLVATATSLGQEAGGPGGRRSRRNGRW